MAKPKKTKITANDYILIDRSGSMSDKWAETLSSVNAYVGQIKKDGSDARITVATFDQDNGIQFDVVRNNVSLKEWKDLTDKDASPRGYTPLFDAIGKIVAMAENSKPEKAVLVVVTDGQENASKEMTKEKAKDALGRFKSHGWQVIFLGADFDAFAQAGSVGINYSQTLTASAANYADTMKDISTMRTSYAGTGATMCVSENLRAKAVKK